MRPNLRPLKPLVSQAQLHASNMKALTFFLSIILLSFAVQGAPKKTSVALTPSQKFVSIIKERNEKFKALQDGVITGKICPASDSLCVLGELKKLGIKSSNDLFNGMTLLSYLIQKKFKQNSDCHEVCRTNLYAEFSDALFLFASEFDVTSLISYESLSTTDKEAKVIKALEDLECFKQLQTIQSKLMAMATKIDPEKVFKPELMQRMKDIKSGKAVISLEALLKQSFLASLPDQDPIFEDVIMSGGRDEKAAKAHVEALIEFQKTLNPETH